MTMNLAKLDEYLLAANIDDETKLAIIASFKTICLVIHQGVRTKNA